jgi:hypothetical protein
MAAFLVLFSLFHRPAQRNRRPVSISDLAVEIGVLHPQQVRDRSNLELERSNSGGQR